MVNVRFQIVVIIFLIELVHVLYNLATVGQNLIVLAGCKIAKNYISDFSILFSITIAILAQ